MDYASDPHLSPAVREFLHRANAGGPPMESLSREDARQALVSAQQSVTVDLSGIEESEKTITQSGLTVKLNIVRPQGTQGILPAFLFIHGGGWVLGDYPSHKRMVRDLVVLSGCSGVFVNYTLSPEAKYPQALHEIYAAATWVASQGESIGVAPGKMAIVGNSAGGNMSAATTLMAKDYSGPDFKVQILMWPATSATFDTESWRLFAKQRFLTDTLMKWSWDQYTTDPAQRKEIYASPLQATTGQLKGLPPAVIVVAENDILRDEGEAYGRNLEEAGVTVTTVRYNGVIHDFSLLNELATLPQTKSMFLQVAGELKKHLGQ